MAWAEGTVKAAATPTWCENRLITPGTKYLGSRVGRTLQGTAHEEADFIRDQGADQGEDVEGNHGHLEQKPLAKGITKAPADHKESTVLFRCATVSGKDFQQKGKKPATSYCQCIGRHDPLQRAFVKPKLMLDSGQRNGAHPQAADIDEKGDASDLSRKIQATRGSKACCLTHMIARRMNWTVLCKRFGSVEFPGDGESAGAGDGVCADLQSDIVGCVVGSQKQKNQQLMFTAQPLIDPVGRMEEAGFLG